MTSKLLVAVNLVVLGAVLWFAGTARRETPCATYDPSSRLYFDVREIRQHLLLTQAQLESMEKRLGAGIYGAR